MHYGVKGMRWGHRKDKPSFGTKRKAKKDAKEYARSKMFYGEGAGNRRKLIKATVNERSKDSSYKREFEKQLAKQDMSKHANKAKSERKRKDASKFAGKMTRGIINISVGNVARASSTAIGLYAVAKITGADKIIGQAAKVAFNNSAAHINMAKTWANTFIRK